MKYVDLIRQQVPRLDGHDSVFCRSWYHENIQNKQSLLIAAGDSWTWGDCLLGIDPESGMVDHPDRNSINYGGLLSAKLDADYINLSQCGSSNQTIIEALATLLSQCTNDYSNIVVVFTLTENFRELIPTQSWIPSDHNSLTEFFVNYEKNMFLEIAELIDTYPTVKFYVSRNFTYSFDENKSLLKGRHLDKTWVDCLYENQTIFKYPTNVRFVSGIALEPLQDYFKEYNILERYEDQYVDYFNSATWATKWLRYSKLNYKKATKHPTEQGHEIWANYLYDQITNDV